MTICVALIGLGEVGQILAVDLAAAGAKKISSYDVLFHDRNSVPSTANVPGIKCDTVEAAVTGHDLVISAVTAASAGDAAASVAPHIQSGSFYLDVNSVSPAQKQRFADCINCAGGRYVEAAIMAPFPPKRTASPILLGGPHAGAFVEAVSGLGFSTRIFSSNYGPASATKMCRSVIIKGIEALLTESLLAARYYGVEKAVLSSLSDLLPSANWGTTARYMISRSLEHGKRRGEEMRQVAETVAEAGVEPYMALATVMRQDWASHFHSLSGVGLEEMLDLILAESVVSQSEQKSARR